MNTRFISMKDLNEADLPMFPDDFENFVLKKCLEQREFLEKNWIPECARIILELKDCWKHLVPLDDDETLDLPMKFFACIASEMSNQLRSMVVDSLEEFAQFFEQYKVNNQINYRF
jgi:dynein heavy chain